VTAQPWEAYAAGSEVDHFAEFCATHLVQWIDAWDGLPLELEPFQRELMGEVLAYDDHGWPVWRSIVIVMPRKNGKTILLAAYAIYRLLTSGGSPEILLAASSDKQAGRLFDACASFVRRSPVLSELCRVRDYVGEIRREDGAGVIFRVASDPARLHGYNPTLVIPDELAQWVAPSLRRAFAALTTGGGARTAPQVVSITTAGEARDRESSILGEILDAAKKDPSLEVRPGLEVARLEGARMLVYNHEAPTSDPFDVKAMKLANPASWITEEYLERQAANPELSDADVLQLHGCVWAAGRMAWLPAGAWAACEHEGERVIEDGESVVLGFDGSYNNDSTALVGTVLGEVPHVFVVREWARPDTREQWVVPRREVEETIQQCFDRWYVVELDCDPPGWHREIEDWEERWGAPPVVRYETVQRKRMVAACSKFFTAVVNRQLTHDGNSRLAEHIGNAVVKETTDGAYITKESRSSKRKIDLAMGAVISYDRATSDELAVAPDITFL
jgi:phage terminase large subunit-like protein